MRILALFALCILLFSTGCSGLKKLTPCDTLSKSDSTEYFVQGLMDHTKLDVSWLKTEIKKEVFKDWLLTYVRKDNEDLLAVNSISTAELGTLNMNMFDGYYKSWKLIESKISPEDKIFYYSTPLEYWTALAGQDGVAVIRDCKIVYVLVLSQS